jgi:hypothetical protein
MVQSFKEMEEVSNSLAYTDSPVAATFGFARQGTEYIF